MELNTLSVDTDSEDELLLTIGMRTRKAQSYKPRTDTFNDYDDQEFFIKFRLTKKTVLRLLEKINDLLESPTNRNFSVSPINKLLLTLRFYATGSFLIVAADFIGVSKSTASRIVRQVTSAIAGLRDQYIKFPDTQTEKTEVQLGFYERARFPRVIGAIDCTHIKIQSPGGDHAEEFRNRKGYFSFNVQTISDHKLRIRDIVARWPGAAHDSTIFNNSAIQAMFETGTFGRSIMVCDSGYACKQYMIPPLRNPTLPEEHLFNEAQIRTRNVVERQYGVWKRRFPILAFGIRLKLSNVQDIIVACAILHNVAVDEKESCPPTDPEISEEQIETAIADGQIDPDDQHIDHNVSHRSIFINYFRNL